MLNSLYKKPTHKGVPMFASEEAVTKLLTKNEILNVKGNLFISNPIMCNLGEFLKKLPLETKKEEVNRFDEKYVFIK